MPASTTAPQPLRKLDPKAWRRQQTQLELWDDLAVTVYSASAATLTIPMPLPGIIQVWASGLLAGAGVLTLNLDGTPVSPTATTTGATTAIIVAALAAISGSHTLTITSGVGISQPTIIARRGRAPSP